MNSVLSLEILCLIMFCLAWTFSSQTHRSFADIMASIFVLLFCFVGFLYVQMCVALHLYVLLGLILWFIFFCFLLLVLLYSSLFFVLFHFFYSLDIYLFSNEKYKGVDTDGRGDQKDLRGTGGGKTINKIYCMKKNLISMEVSMLCKIWYVKLAYP